MIDKWRKYWRITRADEIARRYFINNSFDGVLTTIGLLMGMFLAGVANTQIIITTSLSTGIAIGLSGFWGAFLTEVAERKKKLMELEKSLMRNLKDTEIERASSFASKIVALVDGLSPLLSTIIVILPFFFISTIDAYYLAFTIAGLMLVGLGIFLGRVSKENQILLGLKMLAAGILAIGISYLLLN
ncbi:VIT1/CCC1 transporter family protein [Candidatus Micrarchaeota archaeon]|nr:VIT1/CCC1 transporter family protein [Candidatus Micrarchaeota archaeon]